jgi:enterochelin esterase-like enzyme
VDIALRHPELFRTVESWSGYFTAPTDGPLADAGPATREAHDPARLVRREASDLQRLGTRFFLSSGTSDHESVRDAIAFASELAAFGLPHRLFLAGGRHDGRFWRRQLPLALRYALAPQAAGRRSVST